MNRIDGKIPNLSGDIFLYDVRPPKAGMREVICKALIEAFLFAAFTSAGLM